MVSQNKRLSQKCSLHKRLSSDNGMKKAFIDRFYYTKQRQKLKLKKIGVTDFLHGVDFVSF